MVTEKINEKVNSVSFDNENISDEAKELLTLFTRMISVTGNNTEAYKSISYILWAFYTRSSNVPSIFTSDNDVALKQDKKKKRKKNNHFVQLGSFSRQTIMSEKKENKEIKDCLKELDACYDKLYKCFCEGKFCTECNLGVPYDSCVLCILQDSIEILKEKSDELL